MDTFAVYFKPRGSMATLPSSDTLFGAVCWGMKLLGLIDDLGAWLEQQKESPLFAFSTPYPYIFKRDYSPLLHFFPKPAFLEVSPLVVQEWVKEHPVKEQKRMLIELSGKAKQLNKLAYISQGVLQQIAMQTGDLALLLKKFCAANPQSDSLFAFGKSFLITKEEQQKVEKETPYIGEKFLQDVLVQHNHIDRVTGTTAKGLLFMSKEIWFQPYTGLWALLRARKEDVNTFIKPALKFLEDNGIGANRSVGKGLYEISIQDLPFTLPAPKESNVQMLLSRYLPTQEEMKSLISPYAFRIKTLHPKRESKYPSSTEENEMQPVYKEMVRMFEPGSVFFGKAEKPICGRLAKVVSEDEVPVYQSGAALFIQMQLAEGS